MKDNVRLRPTFADADAILSEELSFSKYSSFAELNFSVGFNTAGSFEYISFSLSKKIAFVLSSLSAKVKPEKFFLTIA